MKKNEKKPKSRWPDLGFLSFFLFWIIASALCYFGILAFDPRTFDGAIVMGLGLSASLISAIGFLKRLYDDGTVSFRKHSA